MSIVTFKFVDELLLGCKIKVKIVPEMPMAAIIHQIIDRLRVILDNFGFENLIKYTGENQWKIRSPLNELLEADEECVFEIEKI